MTVLHIRELHIQSEIVVIDLVLTETQPVYLLVHRDANPVAGLKLIDQRAKLMHREQVVHLCRDAVLRGRRSINLLLRHIQELKRVCEQLVVGQAVRDVVRIGIAVLAPVGRELVPELCSEKALKVLRFLYLIPPCENLALHADIQAASVFVPHPCDNRKLFRALLNFRLDRAHLVQIRHVHFLVQVVLLTYPAVLVCDALLNQNVQNRLACVPESEQALQRPVRQLCCEWREVELEQRLDVRDICGLRLRHPLDLLVDIGLHIVIDDDRDLVGDGCIFLVTVICNGKGAGPLVAGSAVRAVLYLCLKVCADQALDHAERRVCRCLRTARSEIRNRDRCERGGCDLRRFRRRVCCLYLHIRHQPVVQKQLQVDGVIVRRHQRRIPDQRTAFDIVQIPVDDRNVLRYGLDVAVVVLIFDCDLVVLILQRRKGRPARRILKCLILRVVLLQPRPQLVRHILPHFVRYVPDILAAVRVAVHDRRGHQVVAALQAEAVLHRPHVGGIGNLVRQVLPADENGCILSVALLDSLAATLRADAEKVSPVAAAHAAVLQVIGADRPVDLSVFRPDAVKLEQHVHLLRHFLKAVIDCLVVKLEGALDALDAVVNMVDAVVRHLVQQTVHQRGLRVACVIQNRRRVVVPCNVVFCVDLQPVDIYLSELRLPE